MSVTVPASGTTSRVVRPPAADGIPPAVRRACVTTMVLIGVYVLLDAVAQLLPPHYSPITQAESDLAVGPYGWIMTINFVVRGLLSLLFLWAFLGTVSANGGSWRQFRGGTIAIAIWGFGAFVLAAFPTDVPATPISAHGYVHGITAIFVFLGGAIGIYLLSRGFSQVPALRPAERWATGLGIISIVLVVVELTLGLHFGRISNAAGGLLERLFLGSVLLWIFLVSLFLVLQAPKLKAAANDSPGPQA